MRVLTHVCCGPCFTAVNEELKEAYELTACYANPNIHPGLEYRRRLLFLRSFCRAEGVPLLLEDYDPHAYFDSIGDARERPQRCERCYQLRLARVAKRARDEGFDAFTTTLILSPYQEHDLLVEVAQEVSRSYDVDFIYRDLRPYFARSVELSRARNMYRQKYCGCLFSENERYAKQIAGASIGDLP